ncbi:MAG TPA: carboxylesterase family protein, partial [Gemmatimonadaceae bacterium]
MKHHILLTHAAALCLAVASHAHAQSLQYRSPAGVEYRAQIDTGPVARAERALAADPANVQRSIALGTAQAGARQMQEAVQTFTRALVVAPNDPMLYRWRGHRNLSVRNFDASMADLTRGYGIDSLNYGVLYHLGVLRFVRGDFNGAADAFRRAQPRAPDGNELAGATDWLWMSLQRAGRSAEATAMLARRPDSIPVTNAYGKRLKLYRGEIGPDALFTPSDTGDVDVATLSFGLGNWYLVKGDTMRARAQFERSIRSGGWPAFGFIASETELARVRPRVTIDAGTIEGRVDSASRILLFEGIPYAAPPVGALRWRPPGNAASWQGVRRADMLGHNCVQLQPFSDIDPFAAGISEDCLYLNVWTQATTGRRPVMVWIHGGGFFAGFGGEERHNGSVLAEKGAVVVTINYRLGPFGFLAHPALTAESPWHASGNYGIMDQIAALQWVQRNIARFGGDPSRVTIFGESAGGSSVGTLVASPLAKGLFHRAILESGTGTDYAGMQRDSAEKIGVRVARELGVAGTGANAATHLREMSADSVLAASRRTAGSGSVIHRPNIDGYVLKAPVDSTILLGKANLVPVIVGTNAAEPASAFGAPSRAFARLVTAQGAPVFLYQFARVGDDSANRKRGAYHSAEIT